MVITQFIDRLAKNLPLDIFGDGEQTRDFVYGLDVVEANMLALKGEGIAGETFNIEMGVATTINQLASTLLEVANKTHLKMVPFEWFHLVELWFHRGFIVVSYQVHMIVCVFGMERFICIRSVYKIMGAVVPVRVPRELAEKIRKLVEAGVFSNRSVLVREALRRLVVSEGIVAERTTLGNIAARIASVMIVWNEKAVTDVILFGSVARGETAVESDVDLLVLVEDAQGWVVRQRLYDVVYPVILALGVDVSLIVVDRKLFIRMVEKGDPFALSVLRDGVQLHGGFVDEYGEGAFGKGS